MPKPQHLQPPTGNEWGRVRETDFDPSEIIKPPGRAAVFLPDGWVSYKAPLHSSTLRTIGECQRKYMFQDRLGFSKTGTYSPSLNIGTVFHHIQELALRGADEAERRHIAMQAVKTWVELQFPDSIAVMGLLPDGTSIQSKKEQIIKDAEKAIALGEIYYKRYPVDLEKYELVDVERHVSAEVLIGDKPISIQGTLDLVLRSRKTDNLIILDYKTTAKDAAKLMAALKMDIQPALYRLLAMAAFPDSRVTAFWHNVIQKPTISYGRNDELTTIQSIPEAIQKKLDSGKPLTEKQQETYDSIMAKIESDKQFSTSWDKYLHRMNQWYKDRDEKAQEALDVGGIPQPPMLQSRVRLTRTVLTPDVEANLKRASKLQRAHIRPDGFPKVMNMYECVGFGNAPTCPFLELCDTDDRSTTQWPTILGQSFIQRHRDEEPMPC